MKYEKAKAEVVLFDNSDVITTSCGGSNSNKGPDNNCKGGCGNDISRGSRNYGG